MLKPHLGWRSSNYLPHCDAAGLHQHVVFGLQDAADALTEDLEGAFDQSIGECLLRPAAHAEIMQNVLLRDDATRYRLLAWCVMPSHVHVLIEQVDGHRLGDVVQSWKSVAAHRLNAFAKRKGQVWRRDYFDRYMRTDEQLGATIAYIEANPVVSRLARAPEEWRWSSAHYR